jgi:hypothetical protein
LQIWLLGYERVKQSIPRIWEIPIENFAPRLCASIK